MPIIGCDLVLKPKTKMFRYFLHISFQGTLYSGWQSQENSNTVQNELDTRLSQLFSATVQSIGCGRTDSGVHASNFYLHFDAPKEFKTDDLQFKLNKMLPADIVIHSASIVSPAFHARFDAISRTYHYFISKKKDPFLNNLVWHYHQPLQIERMNTALQIVKEYRDFSSFSKSNTQVKTNNCEIFELAWIETPSHYVFNIKANRFLRNMVRAIVGTSLQIGLGKLNQEDLRGIIEAKDRRKASESVPGCGLYLTSVQYPEELLKGIVGKENALPFYS